MNKLIDGIKVSGEIKEEIKNEIDFLVSSGERRPSLTIVLVGKHSASKIYVKAKMKACKEVGINASLISLNDNISEQDLLILIKKLNNKKTEDGFIVQLPLPDHISVQKVIDSINSNKDIDGFTNDNIGSITSKKKKLMPATGLGVLTLIERYNIDIVSKNCVVLGSSRNVGAAIAQILMQKEEVTVTVCNSKTKNLKNITINADIIISAVGKPNLVTQDMVKDGVIIIDVGISRVEDSTRKSGYKIVGDVDFENVSKKAKMISPVPGGVGPMTIVSLLQNTLKAYNENRKRL
tara:strand:+ start:1385 stop:2263 length:879 start_codon:yes stop_codon:yes gene_type:complete